MAIILLVDSSTTFKSELPQSAKFDPELVGFSLVVSELNHSKLLAFLSRWILLCLKSFDAIQSSYQADHVVLEELDQLRVQRRYESTNGGINRRLYKVWIFLWILLILEPNKLIGNKTILI